MIQSGGVLVKAFDTVPWQGSSWTSWSWGIGAFDSQSLLAGMSYGTIYRRQLWVAVLVNKRASATARLPLKVYQRTAAGRADGSSSPYGVLLARPSSQLDPFLFWLWTSSTLDVYGEAFWGKVRDRLGRPVELVPLHPCNIHSEWRVSADGRGRWHWWYDDGRTRIDEIPRRDLVQFRGYNPDSHVRGMSKLEPLRATLENEEGARRANSALWRQGGRPSAVLEHPRTLSSGATERIATSWASAMNGVDNWAKTAVLEEGLTYRPLPLNVEELQYIEGRKLNREEACAVYDVPPPVVHILDRATFSNITEQMRSMYRDTMAPHLGLFESTMDMELRDGRFGEDREPDFGAAFYAEFLMDEVLRGDFEVRAEAYTKAINGGWMQPAEVREKENLPFVDGSDVLLVNSTLVSIGVAGTEVAGEAAVEPVEASVSVQAVRTVMGRLSRAKSLTEVDVEALCAGLNGESDTVAALFAEAVDLAGFKSRLKAVAKG